MKKADKDLEDEYDGDSCQYNSANTTMTSTTTTTTTTTTPSTSKDEICATLSKVETNLTSNEPTINSNKTAEDNEEYALSTYLDFETRCKCIKSKIRSKSK